MEDMKTWYQSRTIWGAVIAISASLAHAGGYSLSATDQGQLADAALSLAGTVGGLISIWGRMKATAKVA
ncbi:hypothetical protein [Rhizobium sp. C4]|uniref:hypothetical protein n=1 Tax=Rhizobium sp. C4 TaxID=1349800 RepID=UPI001E5E56B3|nr:hypothetical protein [Rhizobium sp. C4]MCD2172016.1 hypothetical protein [Rhizobium sp. C4]